MTNEVVDFLKAIATSERYAVFDAMFGSINIGSSFPIHQSSGAVYGIWVQSDLPPSTSVTAIPGFGDWYPVYWGKDVAPVSRMKAHVQGHKNGNIDLSNVREVQNKPLIFGAILVSRYRDFEKLLHERFPPLKGSPSNGRSHTVVHVEN
jgi:hypothetical protein